jgi:hypothetical protein
MLYRALDLDAFYGMKWVSTGQILEKQVGGGSDWIHLAQDRDQWCDLVNMAMNIPVP